MGKIDGSVFIPYGHGQLEVPLQGVNVGMVLEPKAAVTMAQTPHDIVRQALRESFGTR